MSNLNTATKLDAYVAMEEYITGEKVQRPWGQYEVTAVGTANNGEEYCEKEITVNPGQILSLQSHDNRREIWTVVQGTLEVILDGKHHTLQQGQSINVPLYAIHCMANRKSNIPCIVHERQVGVCREEDIIRYVDAYGRATEATGKDVLASVDLYNRLRKVINK